MHTEEASARRKKADPMLTAAAIAVFLMLVLQVFFMAMLYMVLRQGF